MREILDKLRALFRGAAHPDPAPDKARTGEAGEAAAAEHLERAGLKVLARNWRNPADRREELDLVCQDGEVLVFVEVKTRKGGALVGGYHAVDKRKKAVLLRVCRAYLARLRPPPRHYRFDIVEVSHGLGPVDRLRADQAALPDALQSVKKDREVLHFRNVPLFPERSIHRHG